MSGQDATLTLEQARKQQERTSCDHEEHQGSKSKGGSAQTDHVCEKVKHQG
jgi:hypothetical protein